MVNYQASPGDSPVNQLLSIYDTIIASMDKGKDVRFIFCDVTKAFDKVWHRELILKLERYGIKGPLLHWINAYLRGRKQNVVFEGFSSIFLLLKHVSYKIISFLYINDIMDNIDNDVRLFASDTSLFVIVDHNNELYV